MSECEPIQVDSMVFMIRVPWSSLRDKCMKDDYNYPDLQVISHHCILPQLNYTMKTDNRLPINSVFGT
jgi:hypothetical protein